MKRAAGLLVVLMTSAALVACGGGNAKKGPPPSHAASLVPKDAAAFVSVSLAPSSDQKSDVASVLEKLPVKEKTFDGLRDRLLTDVAKDAGLDYQRDVKPWLGDEAAVAVLPNSKGPDVVHFVKTTDDAKAKAAVDKASAQHGADDVARVISGFVVVVPSARADLLDVVSHQASDPASALSAQDSFTRVTKSLRDDRIVTGWFDGHNLVTLARLTGSQQLGGARVDLSRLPDVGSGGFDVVPSHEALSAAGLVDTPGTTGGGPTPLTDALPTKSLFALTLWNIGGNLESALAEALRTLPSTSGLLNQVQTLLGIDLNRDVLSWMHGEAVIVGGPPATGTRPDLAVVVDPTDRAAAESTINKITSGLERLGLKMEQRPAPGGGTEYVLPGAIQTGLQPAMALTSNKFVLASSPEYLAKILDGGDFASSPAYKDTLGSPKPGTQFQAVLQGEALRFLEPYLGLAATTTTQPGENPNALLEHLNAVGVRVRKDGTVTRFEVKATVK